MNTNLKSHLFFDSDVLEQQRKKLTRTFIIQLSVAIIILLCALLINHFWKIFDLYAFSFDFLILMFIVGWFPALHKTNIFLKTGISMLILSHSIDLTDELIFLNIEEWRGTIPYYMISLLSIMLMMTGVYQNKKTRLLQEQETNLLLFQDSLTGLPNRKLLYRQMEGILNFSERSPINHAVMMLDFDNFKSVNDTLGHNTGDMYLKKISNTIKNEIRKSDLLARIGGDEFCIVFSNIKRINELVHQANRILNIINRPYLVENEIIHLSASIGIAVYPHDGMTINELMKSADTALNKAKSSGKNSFHFFDLKMKDEVQRYHNLSVHLKSALKNQEIYTVFQPIVSDFHGKAEKFEALMRWYNPCLGSVSPEDFITIAEDTGMIISLGEWILRDSCQKMMVWMKTHEETPVLSVNISAQQLKDKWFLKKIDDILENTGFPPEQLELEITETRSIQKLSATSNILNEIKDRKIKLSLDDFGTGYSSLNYIRKLPLDTLKIDKKFIDDMEQGERGEKLLACIIELAKTLNLNVIAEGIEKQNQAEFVLRNGCHYMQGYLFSTPLEFSELLKSSRWPVTGHFPL